MDSRAYQQSAARRLRRFRQGSVLAVAITAMLLVVWVGPELADGQELPAAQRAVENVAADPSVAVQEATGTMRDLALSLYAFLPRLLLAALIFAAATMLARLARAVLVRTGKGWDRIDAAIALTRVAVYVAAAVAAISVLAGDARAVVGSVGFLGLAASWALQTPIESFTGWLLNSFRRYYRVGDRIGVGDVFGDVYRIDILTTTVWEAGGAGKPVTAAQPTGALITFPNWEVLRSNIVNYTRDFPYVWDEVTFTIANESDIAYAARVIEAVTRQVLGSDMAEAADRYQHLLEGQGLNFAVEELPRVYVSLADEWTECTVRYVVPVRTRRHWSSTLVLALHDELQKAEHKSRILSVYPRREITIRPEWISSSAPAGAPPRTTGSGEFPTSSG